MPTMEGSEKALSSGQNSNDMVYGECKTLYQRRECRQDVTSETRGTSDVLVGQMSRDNSSTAVDELSETIAQEMLKETRSVAGVDQMAAGVGKRSEGRIGSIVAEQTKSSVAIAATTKHTVEAPGNKGLVVDENRTDVVTGTLHRGSGTGATGWRGKASSANVQRDTRGQLQVSTLQSGATCEMAAKIEDLFEKGNVALASNDLNTAKRTGLTIMEVATQALDGFLQGDNNGVTQEQLVIWFINTLNILIAADATIQAIGCFYIGAVLNINLTHEMHLLTSASLWTNLLIKDYRTLFSDRAEIYDVLDKVFSISKLAKKLDRLELASLICNELVMAHKQLLIRFKCFLMGPELDALKKRFIAKVKSIVLFHAGCLLEMKKYAPVKHMCQDVLKNMCEYDCMEAFELWGRTLFQEKQYDIAEDKIRQALQNAKKGSSNETRLTHLLRDISKEREEMYMHKNGSCDDLSWLAGTAAVEKVKQTPSLEGTTAHSKRIQKNLKKKQYERFPVRPCTTEERKTKSVRSKRTSQKRANKAGDGINGSKCSDNKKTTEAPDFNATNFNGWSDSDDEKEDNTSLCSSSQTTCSVENDYIEEQHEEDGTFYEQSRKFHTEMCDGDFEMMDQTLLKSGLELNMSFMHRFETSFRDEQFYEEYLNKDALRERMLKQPDKFIRCKLCIEGSHLSYCTPIDSTLNIDVIEISGRTKTGQAFNEDEVVVQLLDSEHEEKNKRYGKVIGIWERKRFKDVKHPVFLCTLDDMDVHLVRPMCKTVPKIHILTDEIRRSCPKFKKHRVEVYTYDNINATLSDPKIHSVSTSDLNKYVFLVTFISWKRQFIYPTGAIIRIMPYGETLSRGLSLLNLKHKVPNLYQKAVVDRVESIERRYSQGLTYELEGRVDLTDKHVFTIDPPGSKDLDDALSIETFEDGFKVGVHIADVAHYVQKGDAMDQEAATRATTFYPGINGKRPRNMLPEPLSENMCSLLPNETRLTLSVFFCLTNTGKLQRIVESPIAFRKTFIKSCQQFTYRQVQDILKGRTSHRLQDEINKLFKIASCIRRERLKNAMFAMDIVDEENETDDSVSETLEAHYLVEEFMIMTNKAVAEQLLRVYPGCVPLRCQQPPSTENMMAFLKKHEGIVDLLVRLQGKQLCDYKTASIDSHLGTRGLNNRSQIIVSKTIWESISSSDMESSRKLILTDDLFPLQHLVHQHWKNIQEKGEYKCSSGKNNMSSTRHYSLEINHYTHFTSPIRRYIDLIVHRLLHAALTKSASPYSKSDVDTICSHVNSVAKRAKDYQRECKSLKQAIDLRHRPKMTTCYIDEISDSHITLSSPDLLHVPNGHKELSFSLLDVGFKPEQGEDTRTGTEFVIATWRKRLYDSRGIPTTVIPTTRSRDDRKTLNAYKGSVFIPLQRWARILKCAVEGRCVDMRRAINNTNCSSSTTGFDDISTETLENLMHPYTKFCRTFKPGQSVRVQIAASPWRGVLTPRPILFDMTNNVKFCIQHTDDPVLHLSYYSTSSTCDQYTSTKLYLERWLPLIDMESAINAITNEESCVVNNVPIKIESATEGRINFPVEFCVARNIAFSGTNSEVESGEKFDVHSQCFDWLCLKYIFPVQTQCSNTHRVTNSLSPIWTGHASITSVIKKSAKKENGAGKIVVSFRLQRQSPHFPDEAKSEANRFSVEILRKSEVDRRTESFMKDLQSIDKTLAHTIALNKGSIPLLDSDHVNFADRIDRDVHIPADDGVLRLPVNNPRQQEAIDKALSNRFTLIQGPPGTGKTYTGIKLLYLFNKINGMALQEGGTKHQVLFCGPSNKSVDLVARLMLRRLGRHCPKFVRVYGRSIEAIEYPIPGRTFLSNKGTRGQKEDPDLRSVTLHHLIRQKGKPKAEEINAFDRKFRKSGYAPQDREEIKEYVKMIWEASISEIRKHDVILCTTAVGSNPKILEASKVFQVIIDEAGMCTEPQCMMPIIATKAEQVVLIGDHKQLRPIIKSKQAAELGLDKSLFQRYAESDTAGNVHFTMLDTQYRMNPMLCQFPSKQFYNSQLKTKPGLWNRETMDIWPKAEGKSYPHVLIPVEGEEKTLTVSTDEGNEHSRSNLLEIETVVKVFRYFIDEGVGANDINIMSQYNAQCAEIRNRLAREGFTNYNVTTVVSSQGGEWGYVIFSTVRSLPDYKIEKHPTQGWCKQNLGFITDENQINVALTRARKGLVIVGNQRLLRCDKVFGNLISRYEHFDCIREDGSFPPPPRTRRQRRLDAKRRGQERYGRDMFIRGEATSYVGNYDVSDDGDEF